MLEFMKRAVGDFCGYVDKFSPRTADRPKLAKISPAMTGLCTAGAGNHCAPPSPHGGNAGRRQRPKRLG
jgi:hypothetical protein